ncbi:6875_t:CDS:2, partial [Rhizophagus irregularis]
NWKRGGKLITLKSFKLDDDNIKEVAHEIKLRHNNDSNNVMMGLYGITKIDTEPSKQAVFTEDGELNISLCEDQPLLYTSINDRNSRKNLLSFNSADDSDVELDDSLQPSDIFINFP